MHSIFKYRFIAHPTFQNGIVLSNIHPKIDNYVDVYFFDSKTVKQFKKSFILEKCSDIEIIKINDLLNFDLLDLIFNDFTESKGEKYVSDSRMKIKAINDYFVEAVVIGTHAYSVSIRTDQGFLDMRCSCPVQDDECKHVYALMKYLLCKYEGKEVKEITPFEDVFNRLFIADYDNYFELGFEACRLFLERPETSGEIIAKSIQSFDYYSNRSFAPIAINDGVYKFLMENLNYEGKTRLNKIRTRYIKAVEGRNFSYDDIVIGNVFSGLFEKVFSYNIHDIYLSPISRAGLIYAALHTEITLEIAHILSKINLKENEARKVFAKTNNKGAKKLIYMVYPQYFHDLSKEEIAELEYTPEDIYESFKSSSSLSMAKIINNNAKTFISKNKEEYLPGMIMEALSYSENQRNYFLDLYRIIESLSNNSMLLKIDFKGQKQTADSILKRWRGYDGRGFNDNY